MEGKSSAEGKHGDAASPSVLLSPASPLSSEAKRSHTHEDGGGASHVAGKAQGAGAGAVEGQGEDGEDGEVEVIAVKSIRFNGGSNLCPVSDPLDFAVTFSALRPLDDVTWEVKYLVDCVRNRNILILGRTPATSYSGADCKMTFRVDRVDVSHIKPSHLSNAGLLICTLLQKQGPGGAEKELADIKMVVQVSTQAPTGQQGEPQLVRCVYNPME